MLCRAVLYIVQLLSSPTQVKAQLDNVHMHTDIEHGHGHGDGDGDARVDRSQGVEVT